MRSDSNARPGFGALKKSYSPHITARIFSVTLPMSPLRVSLTGVCFQFFLEELSITANFKRCNFVFREEKSLLLENYCVSRQEINSLLRKWRQTQMSTTSWSFHRTQDCKNNISGWSSQEISEKIELHKNRTKWYFFFHCKSLYADTFRLKDLIKWKHAKQIRTYWISVHEWTVRPWTDHTSLHSTIKKTLFFTSKWVKYSLVMRNIVQTIRNHKLQKPVMKMRS